MKYLIEIAVNDFKTASAAVEGGADRIELCAALSEGGITPSYSIIRLCRETFGIPIFPIIRPRGGDFLYTEEEKTIMRNDVLLCRELGCEGVVVGALTLDGQVDQEMAGTLRELAYPMEVTFHRAFDRCADPYKALEVLIELGFQRVLTSGQQPTAPLGAELIRELVKAAGERIIILPGSGIRPHNARELAATTGAAELHASLSRKRQSPMEFKHPAFAESDDYTMAHLDPANVRALRAALEG